MKTRQSVETINQDAINCPYGPHGNASREYEFDTRLQRLKGGERKRERESQNQEPPISNVGRFNGEIKCQYACEIRSPNFTALN